MSKKLDVDMCRSTCIVCVFLEGRYIPRAILTDLETGVLDSIQSEMCAPLFDTNNFIAGISGAANNFAKGYYGGGPELLEPVVEIIRYVQ